MTALFVTGAGTGVGKTYVTALLARHMRLPALKPVISGFDPAAPDDSDSAILLRAMGEAVTPETLAAMSPWRYAAPLAPNMAARLEGRSVEFTAVVAWCEQQTGPVLIEGVGGVMSPLSDEHTVLDWIAALRCPSLLVSGSYLGTISHTLTAVEAMRARGVRVAGIVVSESEDGVDLDATATELRRFTAMPVVTLRRSAAAEQVGLDQVADLHALARKCLAD